MVGPQDALDDPNVRMVIVVGPERTGKSVSGENHLFKRMRNGPMTDVAIYLQASSDVESYANKEFRALIDLHPEINRKIPGYPKKSENNAKASKRVSGKEIKLYAANDAAFRGKEAPYIIATETDGYRKGIREKFAQEIAGRQKSFGQQAKAYIESHPDLGANEGIAAAWRDTTMGIYWWPCDDCGAWSSPHFMAPKGFQMKLDFERDDDLDDQARLLKVQETARLSCPHCGTQLDDAARDRMCDEGKWIFNGQTIDEDGIIGGEIIANEKWGFWIVGTMSKLVPLGKLARELVAATIVFERTKKTTLLKRATVKSLGEIYEGAGSGSRTLNPTTLREMADTQPLFFERGTFPEGFQFIVGAVDIGARKFDAGFWAFDLEGRSALIERFTIMTDEQGRDIRPAENIAHWMQLRKTVLERRFTLANNDSMYMPVAAVAFDTGGAGTKDKNDVRETVTEKAREFARRMHRAGVHWGANRFQRVKLIKGFKSKVDAEILGSREINLDENRRPVSPIVREFNLNVDALKAKSVERLATEDGGPGQCYFADGLPKSVFEELCAEVLVDGVWEHRGKNETFDLFGYAEAVRIMLDPDRAQINWLLRPPVWARPISLTEEGGDPAVAGEVETPKPVEKKSIFQRFDDLNRN